VLEDNSGNDLSLGSNGAFVFTKGIKNGDAYRSRSKSAVQPRAKPAPSKTVPAPSTKQCRERHRLCSHTGNFAYVANQLSNDVSAYAIDSASGNLTAISGSRLRCQARPGVAGP